MSGAFVLIKYKRTLKRLFLFLKTDYCDLCTWQERMKGFELHQKQGKVYIEYEKKGKKQTVEKA